MSHPPHEPSKQPAKPRGPRHANRFSLRRSKKGTRSSHPPEPIEAVLGRALEDAGVPSAHVTKALHEAWRRCATPAWRDHTRLRRIRGGVLEIAVQSSALRDELVNYHRDRLLRMLREAAPSITLVGLRFVLDPAQFFGIPGTARD